MPPLFPTLHMPTTVDVDPFDAALSLLALPPAARRIIPTQQPKRVRIVSADAESRRRVERRIGL